MISKAVPARMHTRTFAIGVDYVTAHTHQRALVAAGTTFEGGVTYASAPEKAAWVHLRGVMSVETAALEMEAVAALSRQCPDPAYHLIIAYAKHEKPSREQVVSDAERLLKAVDMDDHQYVLAAHTDTDDFHAHVIANRIGPDGRANNLWHERINRERVCAEIAAERGWDIVVGHHNRDIVQRIERLHDLPAEPERRLSDGAYRRLHERGELPWEDVARPYILDAVDHADGWRDLEQRLAVHRVVVKLVRRGERVQGLAFAEGLERTAPGCAASRIDARCALAALERRFGPYVPSNERMPDVAHEDAAQRAGRGEGNASSMPWSDEVRPTILAAIDAASSWDDLKQRLDRHHIVVKLIERGGRVQGLAFAQGTRSDAPGCSASRIDPRCKMATLEQRFGPFPRAQQQRQERPNDRDVETAAHRLNDEPRARAQHDARSDPDRALREAGRIVDNARLRSAYTSYRDRFYADRDRSVGAHRNAAWARERVQRQLEAQRRREARQLLRATARLGTHGLLVRQAAYWSIDVVIAHRRAQECDAARVRWQATKIVLAAERGRTSKEKAMDYRSFVTEQARAGDAGAKRVLDMLATAAREQQHRARHSEPQRRSLGEVRARLDIIRVEEEARYQQASTARERLERVAQPPNVADVLAAERQRTKQDAAQATQLTDTERARLRRLAEQQRSWNPLTRAIAAKAEVELQAARRARYGNALALAMHEFERREVPQLTKRLSVDERRYREYVAVSLALEDEMRDARTVLRGRLPEVEHRVNILERAGVTHVEGHGIAPDGRVNQLAAAVEQQYRDLPETVRRDAERDSRREQHARDRSRESMSMGDR
jgi:hypothetical protein